jgi:hypothetical protein
MATQSWWRWITGSQPADKRKSSKGRRAHKPLLEPLEPRLLLYNTFVSLGDPDAVWSSTNLSYSYSNLLDGGLGSLSSSQLITASEEAMGAWAAVTPLRFYEVPDAGPPPGDGNYDPSGLPTLRWGHHSIDGSAGLNVLAHGFKPGDGGINGDMHFDDGNTFTYRTYLETAIHEFGHAIGMAHANGDVAGGMCPTPKPAIMDACAGSYTFSGPGGAYLLQDDIDGIRSLYGTGLGYVLDSGNGLHVYGTGGDDVITVSTSRSRGDITVSSSSGGSFTRDLLGISSITIDGQGGADTISIQGNGRLSGPKLGSCVSSAINHGGLG